MNTDRTVNAYKHHLKVEGLKSELNENRAIELSSPQNI